MLYGAWEWKIKKEKELASSLLSNATTNFDKIESGHFRSDLDVVTEELRELLDLAARVKKSPQDFRTSLSDCYLAWLTEKDSLRTTCTFQLAIKQLGGDCVLPPTGLLGEREAIKDVASNLGQWVQVIAARTYKQSTVEDLATHAGVPVINALSGMYHPCQALGDMQSLQEVFGNKLNGLVLTFVGDGNNVCNSLMLNAVRLGMEFRWTGPDKYRPSQDLVENALDLAAVNGGDVVLMDDPVRAVTGAQVVYTDTWVSMGNESETEQRNSDFFPYQVNDALFAHAAPDAVFGHCLPAHRGKEVVNSVIDSKRSIVKLQACNRLHAQKALLLMLVDRPH